LIDLRTTSSKMASIPKTMRAWQYSSAQGGLEKNLQLLDDVPVPALSTNKNASEVLVETIAASINPADYKDAELPFILKSLSPKKTPTPATPGMVRPLSPPTSQTPQISITRI